MSTHLAPKSANAATSRSGASGPSERGMAQGTLLECHTDHLGTLQYVVINCGRYFSNDRAHTVTGVPEGVHGVLKRNPRHIQAFSRGEVVRGIDAAVASLAEAVNSPTLSRSGSVATMRAAFKGSGNGDDRTHTVVLEVAAHSVVKSLTSGVQVEIMLSSEAIMELKEVVAAAVASAEKHLLQGNGREQGGEKKPARVVLYLNTCFTPSTCVPTQRAIKALTTSCPAVEVITHREKVKFEASFDFSLALHRALLRGQSVANAARAAAATAKDNGPAGVLLFSSGASTPYIPLKRGEALPLPSSRKRKGEEQQDNDEEEEEVVGKVATSVKPSAGTSGTPTPPRVSAVDLGYLPSTDPRAVEVLSGDDNKRGRLAKLRTRIGKTQVVLVQCPVEASSPFFALRDPLDGHLFSTEDRMRAVNVDGKSWLDHKKSRTVSAKHIPDLTRASIFSAHGMISDRDFAIVAPHLAAVKNF